MLFISYKINIKGSKESPKITFLPVERRKCARPGCNNFSMNDKIYCSNECILRFAQMTKGNTAEVRFLCILMETQTMLLQTSSYWFKTIT